ncbi:restriction endonuclease subunit S [Vibrio vulnificus]|nr:restriction endonuclease subunit S [Vibrio vulnificus]
MKFKSYSFKELLSNIVDNRGKTCPVGDTGLPLIATNCIKEHSLYPVFEKVRYVSDETYNNWFRGHPQPGDMIFVCKGSPGRVNWVPDPVNFCIAQDMVAIRADTTKVYPKYLFALLRSQTSQQKILNMHVGSLIPHFKKGDFGNLYFELPEDLEYQKKVGDAYFDFCLKIESNTQTNQTLEQMAQAIFKSWFVDFDPVKAKMNGEQPEGMDAATASLFPEKLDSETGIPDGWKLSEIGDEVTVVGGGTPSKKNDDFWVDGDIHWTSPKDLSGVQDKVLLDTASKVTEAGLKKISSGLLPVDTVLLSSRAPVGYLALAKVPMAINQGYIALRNPLMI